MTQFRSSPELSSLQLVSSPYIGSQQQVVIATVLLKPLAMIARGTIALGVVPIQFSQPNFENMREGYYSPIKETEAETYSRNN